MKWMTMRELFRMTGPTAERITEPTVITVHGRPIWTIFPHGQEPKKRRPTDTKGAID